MSVPAQLQDATPRVRFGLRGLLVVLAYSYPTALLALTLALFWIGESWWITAAGLYAPRLPFALPLPVTAVALWVWGPRRLLWTQAVAAAIVFLPLMGFVVPWLSVARPVLPTLRILSLNVNSGFAGVEPIASRIFAESPDLVLLQEAPWTQHLVEALRQRYPYVQSSTQFIIASRHRILSSSEPERLPFFGRARSPRFMRYTVETPLGPIAVYCVHPISPRGVLHIHQFRAAFHQLRKGQLLAGDPEGDVRSNAALRGLQIAAVADQASRESLPVVIAGDTNLPGLSALFREHLSRYTDAFRAASWGFGYTYPSKHPFLRLDRILTNEKLRVVSFRVGCQGLSDHLCIMADIQAAQ